MRKNEQGSAGIVALLVGLAVFAVLGLTWLFSSMTSIDTGKIGVVTNYGKVTGKELSEGLTWIAPFGIESVTEYDVKTQKVEVSAAAATKDLQDVNATLVLNYQLQRGEVSKVHQTIGADYNDKLVLPAVQEVFKAASAKFTAQELITSRPEVKKVAYDALAARLSKYGITVQDLSIVNQQFSAEFNKSIESTQVAQQEVLKAKQELEKVRVDAEKQIAEAQAQAEAQRLKQATLTPELLQQEAIKKWDGKLPQYSTTGSSIFNLPAVR